MKRLLSALTLSLCLLAQAGDTDFPVELLGSDLSSIHLPYKKAGLFSSKKTTGELIKDVASLTTGNSVATTAKRAFIRAAGELLEIIDKSDFSKLFADYGYSSLFAESKLLGKYTDRTIDISGYYNKVNPPELNEAVERLCTLVFGPLANAQSKLNDILLLDWNESFKFDVVIGDSIKIVETDYYIDKGDVFLIASFGKFLEGALYFLRSMDIKMSYPELEPAFVDVYADFSAEDLDVAEALDLSPFARFSIRSANDLTNARAAFAMALEHAKSGDAIVKARTDNYEHLMQYNKGGLTDIVKYIFRHGKQLLECIDQLQNPLDLSSATVPVKPLEMAYTGRPQSPLIGTVTVNGVSVPYDLTGTVSATEPGTYEMTLVGYGRSTGSQSVTWKIVVPPSLRDDSTAKVTDDGKGGYVITPSAGKDEVVVTIPTGVDAAKVAIEVSPSVKKVTLNGALLHIVRQVAGLGNVDIASFLYIPAADKQGVIDLTKAVVKEEIVKEALDTAKDAVIQLNAQAPSLTTAKTRPGLVYTVVEGTTLGGMTPGDSKVGDGKPWTPTLKVKGGTSGFYIIRVTK